MHQGLQEIGRRRKNWLAGKTFNRRLDLLEPMGLSFSHALPTTVLG